MADLSLDELYFGQTRTYIDTNNTVIWVEIDAYDIQIAYRDDLDLARALTNKKKYLMHYLGRGFGLADPGDDIDTEVMSWGGSGSGPSYDSNWVAGDKPDWGEGDKIAFGLVGANNGCIN